MKSILGLALVSTGALADGKMDVPLGKMDGPIGPIPEYKTSKHNNAIEVPAIPYCPDGSQYDPELGCMYVDFKDPKPDCPHPYKLDKKTGHCVTKTYGESQLICTKGSYLDGKHCVAELTAPVEIFCKKGDAVLTDEGCMVYSEKEVSKDEYIEPKWDCPKGFKLEGKVCVAELKADSELVCEKGAVLQKNKCVTVDYLPPICDKGFSVTGFDCDANEIVQPIGICPKHSVEMKGQCMQEIKSEPMPVCEKGYELNKKGKCEARIMITAIPDNGKKDTNFQVDCKKGEIDKNGNCFQFYYSHPVDVCDKGFEMHKKHCISYIPVEMDWTCPKKYEMSKDGQCVKNSHKKAKCPKKYDFDEKMGMCVAYIKEKPAQICPKGSSSLQGSKGHCKIQEFETPIPYCKKHYDLVGDMCVKPGMVKAGKNKMYKPVVKCPKKYKLDHDGMMCTSYVKTDSQLICEKGYELHGKKCIAYHTTAPQGMCPKGYNVSNDGSQRCMRVSYSHPVFTCPKGSYDHGKSCYMDNDNKDEIILMPVGKK